MLKWNLYMSFSSVKSQAIWYKCFFSLSLDFSNKWLAQCLSILDIMAIHKCLSNWIMFPLQNLKSLSWAFLREKFFSWNLSWVFKPKLIAPSFCSHCDQHMLSVFNNTIYIVDIYQHVYSDSQTERLLALFLKYNRI